MSDYVNRHDLRRLHGPGPHVVCPNVERRDRAELAIRRANIDYPWDGVMAILDQFHPHDATCIRCKGRNVMRPQIVINYWCAGCGHTGSSSDFERMSCLGLGAGFYEYQRDLHPIWHTNLVWRDSSCSICAEERMLADYEEREARRRQEGDQVVRGLAVLTGIINEKVTP